MARKLRLCWVLLVFLAAAEVCRAQMDGPFIVCTKDTPPMSQCNKEGASFSGYDVEVFRGVATLLGLKEETDYQFKCMNTVDEIVNDLLSGNGTCALATGGITVSTERLERGLNFSRATYSSTLGVLVPAKVQTSDGFFFVKPFAWTVWLAIGLTLVAVPFIAFLVESLSLKGRIKHKDWRPGLRMSYWETTWISMQNGGSHAKSSATRLILLAFGAMAVVLLNCYCANLTAFLTISKFQTSISSIDELRWTGKAVGSVGVYIQRLENMGIVGKNYSGFRYLNLGNGSSGDWLTDLQQGLLAAFVYDDPLLRYIDSQITSCNLRMLERTSLPFDYAIIFPNNTDPEFLRQVDSAILVMQEDGDPSVQSLRKLREEFFQFKQQQCKLANTGGGAEDGFSISFSQVWGVWVLFGGFLALALIMAAFLIPRRKKIIRKRTSMMSAPSSQFVVTPASACDDSVNGKGISMSSPPSCGCAGTPVAGQGGTCADASGPTLDQVQRSVDAAMEQMHTMALLLQEIRSREARVAAYSV